MDEASREAALLTSLLRRLAQHSFDDAFGASEEFKDGVAAGARDEVAAALQLGQDTVQTILVADGGYDLVFSADTLRKLHTGELKLPFDKKSGLLRIDARDDGSQIRELGKVTPRNGAAIVCAIKAGAHVIADIDTQAQLRELNLKLDALLRFVRADRIGELRGAYNELTKALSITDDTLRAQELRALQSQLGALASRFYQTAVEDLRAIEDPSNIGFLEALTTSQSAAESALRKSLAEATSDLRACQFAWLLQTAILQELGAPELVAQHREIVSRELSAISSLLEQKLAYLSIELRDNVRLALTAQTRLLPSSIRVALPTPEAIRTTEGSRRV